MLIGQGWLRLLTLEERYLLIHWLPPSNPRVLTCKSLEAATVEKILRRVTAPIGRG